MKKIENDCVGCPLEMGCFGKSCPYVDVPHYYCDKCGDEAPLYYVDGQELCEVCALNTLEKVEESWN